MPSEDPSRATDLALRERVKELACLYEIAQLSVGPVTELEQVLAGIVEIVRRAWQYPDNTCARILLDSGEYVSAGFREGKYRQATEIVVAGIPRGGIDVFYLEPRPERDEGPFLKEERSLLEAVAAHIASVVERREAEEERAVLQDQLRHADRLATLGLLAAGVAHELNEPLNNVLGFAELAKKHPGLPEQVRADIGRIEASALQARGTIRKLLVFARQAPPQKSSIDLNRVVIEALQFFEARCDKEGVELISELRPGLPHISADASQLNQVVVNLLVNALQAMPEGGQLTLRTELGPDSVLLVVEDTGVGMTDDVAARLFVPFFTTKDVGQGTGLGLPVAHGIVAAHGGAIRVQSSPGSGSRFTIQLPIRREDEPSEIGEHSAMPDCLRLQTTPPGRRPR